MRYDRFDLEQHILECWKITDDISTLEETGASTADMVSLACVYEYKFKKLWTVFETIIKERSWERLNNSSTKTTSQD